MITDINIKGENESDYYSMVADLLSSDVVLSMKSYPHHGQTTCFQHCLNVSYYNYKLCKRLGLNERAGARAGLLHDLFLYDWHCYKPAKHERHHGFTHAQTARENAEKYFCITQLEADIIEKHMWPLNLCGIPRYRETMVIVLVDKYCGLLETVDFRRQLFAHRLKKLTERVSRKKA